MKKSLLREARAVRMRIPAILVIAREDEREKRRRDRTEPRHRKERL
jgi:hypothetical protein